MDIYKIEKDYKELYAIVYDDPIGTKDRIRIVYLYCAFFVNPLMQLVAMASSMENQDSKKATKELQTP